MTLRHFALYLPIVATAGACSPPGSGSPPAPEPSVEPASAAREAVGDALPLGPTQLAELESALRSVHSLTTRMQGASQQGRARLVQRELSRFLDGLDRPVPFRDNLERIVGVLSKSSGDELTDGEKEAVRAEVQSVLEELGVDTTNGDDDGLPAFGPPPGGPGPGGPRPPPPGPGPGPPGPKPGPPGPGPGPPR